jgi:uncharacterized protein with ParB-like and HNH nuclease domain
MKADSVPILEFIGASKRTFCIPVYQRNYDWKKTQCTTLFNDIETIAAEDRRDSHFLGTIVYVESESNATFRTFIVIDGQQRLTTIMILLKAIVDLTEDKNLREDIIESYLTNRRCDENLRIKLKPMKSDAKNYEMLINDQISEMNDSQIFDNYRLFRELISDSLLSPEQLYKGIEKLEIVYIQLNQDRENPQLIFESLNSTGLDLTQADLIRNYLLMGQEYRAQEELYNKYWIKLENILPDVMISEFIRDYLTLKTGSIPNQNAVYSAFKKYYTGLQENNTEAFLIELTKYGEYYSSFKYCNGSNPTINQKLAHFQKLKSTTVYPFLLYVFEQCYMKQVIDEAMVVKTMDVLLSYVMRRLLCEMPTNALNKVFSGLAREVEKNNSGEFDEKVINILAGKSGKTIFPNDATLRDRMLSRDSYKFPHIKFVLEQIECKQSKETVEFENLTVEHIMPQTLSAKWRVDLGKRAQETYDKYVHNIGNLTLTGYNSELSNDPFDIKRKQYQNSNVCITKRISEYEHWNEAEIIERANYLIDEINKIWKCPEMINNAKFETDIRTEFDIMDELDVTGRTPVELEVCGEIFSINSWRAFLQNLCAALYEYDPQVFRSLVNHSDFKGRSRKIIDDNASNLRTPLKIADNLFIEMNLSANDVLNYSKMIVDKFEGMDEACSYKLKAIV